MTQRQQIVNTLKRAPIPGLTTRQIAQQLGLPAPSVRREIGQLRIEGVLREPMEQTTPKTYWI